MKRWRLALVFFPVTLTCCLTFSVAQPQRPSLSRTEQASMAVQDPKSAEESEGYVYKGAELPLYFVVDSFFSTLQNCYAMDPDQRVYAGVLRRNFGVTIESRAGQALTRAMQDVARMQDSLLQRVYDPPNLDSAAEKLRKRVLGLKMIYRRFLREWELAGESAAMISDFLEREVRPGDAVISSDGRRPDMMAIAEEFDTP